LYKKEVLAFVFTTDLSGGSKLLLYAKQFCVFYDPDLRLFLSVPNLIENQPKGHASCFVYIASLHNVLFDLALTEFVVDFKTLLNILFTSNEI
jgi:hypothetical protein